jgi:hypothetical protein
MEMYQLTSEVVRVNARPGVRSNYSIIGLTVGRDAPAAIGPGGGRQPAELGKRDRA